MRVGQSRGMSLVESVANIAIGLGVALFAQLLIFPLFGIRIPLSANFQIAALFTIVSLARSYCVRRLFNWMHTR